MAPDGDRLCELFAEWLETEMGSDEVLAKVHGFVKGSMRDDLQNLCLYTWAHAISGRYDDEDLTELSIRVAQYLVEREYFSVEY